MIELLLHSANAGLAVFALITLSAVVAHLSLQFRRRKYPPGPWGDPLIGQLRRLTLTSQPQMFYKEMNDKYGANTSLSLPLSLYFLVPFSALQRSVSPGDVVHISAPGQTIILLGSWEAANQLLGKRGSIYSERPPTPFSDVVLVFRVHFSPGIDLV